MNTYSNPLTLCYPLGSHNFGAGADTHDIKGPPGMKGRLRNVLLYKVTAAFTATTTSAKIRVGTTADPDKYIEVDCATTAIDAVVSNAPDPDVYLPAATEIAADSIVRVSYVAPTGGTPAGTGETMVAIDWYE